MPDFIETTVFHPGTGFFTADPTGAVHNDFFIFMFLHHLDGFWQLFTERISRNFQCVLEMPHFVFVVITHIDKYGVRIVQHRVHFCRFEILAHVTGIERRIVNAVRHDTLTHLHAQHPERFAVIIKRDVETHVVQCRIKTVEKIAESTDFAFWHADLRVDALMSEINTPKYIQRLKGFVERVTGFLRLSDGKILIERDRYTRLSFGQHAFF